jgi:hypothetical protein
VLIFYAATHTPAHSFTPVTTGTVPQPHHDKHPTKVGTVTDSAGTLEKGAILVKSDGLLEMDLVTVSNVTNQSSRFLVGDLFSNTLFNFRLAIASDRPSSSRTFLELHGS